MSCDCCASLEVLISRSFDGGDYIEDQAAAADRENWYILQDDATYPFDWALGGNGATTETGAFFFTKTKARAPLKIFWDIKKGVLGSGIYPVVSSGSEVFGAAVTVGSTHSVSIAIGEAAFVRITSIVSPLIT